MLVSVHVQLHLGEQANKCGKLTARNKGMDRMEMVWFKVCHTDNQMKQHYFSERIFIN